MVATVSISKHSGAILAFSERQELALMSVVDVKHELILSPGAYVVAGCVASA